MTPDQRFQVLLWALGIVGAIMSGLVLMALRALWSLASTLQEDRDATRANTQAVDRLTSRVDRLELAPQTPRRGRS
jgi:hypothetical protein